MDLSRLCRGCFRELPVAGAVCPHCGFDEIEYEKNRKPEVLPLDTVLQGKYILGKCLGNGGFGITYIGWHIHFEEAFAIKELYPSGIVFRDTTGNAGPDTVSVRLTGSDTGDDLEKIKQGFLKEARTLRKVHLPGVVEVHDCFEENGTVYLVMDYIRGIDFRTYMEKNGGKISEQETLRLMHPVIKSLEKLHEKGIIHRDISPDNILLNEDGEIILIDFGSARDVAMKRRQGQSMTVVVKPGYAPMEQYNSHGQQGPWTDVYALCATMFRMMTGETPDDPITRSMDKKSQEKLYQALRANGVSNQTCATLAKGMEQAGEDRFQSMQELEAALYTNNFSAADDKTAKAADIETVYLFDAARRKRKIPESNEEDSANKIFVKEKERETVSDQKEKTDQDAQSVHRFRNEKQESGNHLSGKEDQKEHIREEQSTFKEREVQSGFSNSQKGNRRYKEHDEEIDKESKTLKTKKRVIKAFAFVVILAGILVPVLQKQSEKRHQELIAQKESQEASEKASEAESQEASEKASEAESQKASEAESQEASEKASEAESQEASEKASEAESQKASEAESQKASEAESQEASEKAAEAESQEASEKESLEASEKSWEALKAANVGDYITLGHYEQDNDNKTPYGTEPIEWLVLDKQDDTVLVISRYGLDAKPYDNYLNDTTWDTCTLRTWLNYDFYNKAFSKAEREKILETTVSEEIIAKGKKPVAGQDTKDKIFLLSTTEARNLFKDAKSRICYPTAYAKAQGAYTYGTQQDSFWWWLRNTTTHSYIDFALGVFSNGEIDLSGRECSEQSRYMVRPALWIDLKS